MLDAVAVNVTGVPAQIAPDGEATMLTVGVIAGLIVTLVVVVLEQLPLVKL